MILDIDIYEKLDLMTRMKFPEMCLVFNLIYHVCLVGET